MKEKKLSPEYCKNGKIRAYQCGICDRLDVDDVTDKRFCRAGFSSRDIGKLSTFHF